MQDNGNDLSMGQFVVNFAVVLYDKNILMPPQDSPEWHLLFYGLQKACNGSSKPSCLEKLSFKWEKGSDYAKSQTLSKFLSEELYSTCLEQKDWDAYSLKKGHYDLFSPRYEALDKNNKAWLAKAVELAEDRFPK